MVFLTFIGRPAAVFCILAPFRASLAQMSLVSFAGLRGVASIVFSIYVVLKGVSLQYDIFNLVFVIVLLSLAFQGTLLPWASEKLKMTDPNADILKTFNDYQAESDVSFIKLHVTDSHPYSEKKLKDLPLPGELLVVLLLREQKTILPSGDTILRPGDLLVMAAPEFEDRRNLTLYETSISKNHKLKGKYLKELPKNKSYLIVMIKRGESTIIPNGDTQILAGDVLVSARL